MPRHSIAFYALLFVILLVGPAFGSAAFADSPVKNKNSGVPSPQDILGFKPGDDRTIADWKQITNYFNRLNKASTRVHVETLGKTTLGRDLFVAFISSPENIRDLEKYKAIQKKLADPRLVKSDVERNELLNSGKTVVAISCSIHSSEVVASQMSMQLAFELATAQDSETRQILQNTILILIPSPNPDGVDIVADWYRKTLSTPFEGKEPPELYHYYAGHDDNRDWFMLNLRETRLVTDLFWKQWFPEIVYDIHQQGTTGSRLFIPPFYDPPNPRIDPILLRQVGLIGSKMAADLESKGFKGVITNALYDTWWHGGFRTAPYFHNSIGILSEAASARLMTPVTITPEQLGRSFTRGMPSALQSSTNFPAPWLGGEWRPRDIADMELIAAKSVLSLAGRYRRTYLSNFYNLGRKNVETAPAPNEPLAYLIPAGQGNEENVAKTIDALVNQGVEVQRLDKEMHVRFDGTKEFVEAPAGSYIVFLSQPFRPNVQSLFERQHYPDRRAPNGDAERPYDVAGWTLPLQMGIETQSILEIRESANERKLKLIADPSEVRRDFGLTEANKTGDDRPAPMSLTSPVPGNVRIGLYRSFTSNMDEGWTRFVFDTFNVSYKSVLDTDVQTENLSEKFDVIILPSISMKAIVEGNAPESYPEEYTGGITEKGVKNLRMFVENGGTLICFDASSEFAIKRFGLPLKNVVEGLKSSEFYCPGSILKVELDKSTATATHLSNTISAYFINSSAFEVTDASRVRVLARYAPSGVLQSGWLLGEKYLSGKVALAEVPLGKGNVVLFGFRPQHRGQTWGTFPLIWNAINNSVH
jgi:hypothetical protein